MPQQALATRTQQSLALIERELNRDPSIKSAKTRRGYQSDLKGFHDFRKSAPITKLLVEEYASMLQAEGKAPATINRVLASIRWLTRRLSDLAYEDSSVPIDQRDELALQAARVALVRGVHGSRLKKGRMIERGELAGLLAVCFESRTPDGARSAAGVRDAAIFTLAYTAGLRISEISKLKLEHLVRESGQWTVKIIAGKGDKDRAVPVGDEAKKRLREWLRVRQDQPGWLFLAVNKSGKVHRSMGMSETAISKMLDKRMRQAGLKPLSFHDFRRTFASTLLDRGVDIVTVKELMGHENVNTTAQYDRRDDRARRAAIEKLMEVK